MSSGQRCRCEWMTQKIKPSISKHFGNKNFLFRSFSRKKRNFEKDFSSYHRCFKSLLQLVDWIFVNFTLITQGQLYRRLVEKINLLWVSNTIKKCFYYIKWPLFLESPKQNCKLMSCYLISNSSNNISKWRIFISVFIAYFCHKKKKTSYTFGIYSFTKTFAYIWVNFTSWFKIPYIKIAVILLVKLRH